MAALPMGMLKGRGSGRRQGAQNGLAGMGQVGEVLEDEEFLGTYISLYFVRRLSSDACLLSCRSNGGWTTASQLGAAD